MKRRLLAPFKLLSLYLLVVSHTQAAIGDDRLFEQQIRPLLVSHCLECHGPEKQKGGLRLDTRKGLLDGGDSGPAINLDRPETSLLLSALNYEDLEMPPKAPLDPSEIRQVESWINKGALWPSNLRLMRQASNKITQEDRNWWAFKPISKPPLPQLDHDDRSRNPIDHFVRSRLKAQSMTLAPPAEDSVLLRRVYFSLLGVPPSADESQRYLNDERINKWDHLVERLLSDPRYGEHWARFWLDLVRYSDSDGWNQDAFRPHIWRYRDYVINALNGDKPYTEFVREQLAGDELSGDNPEALTATGFLRLGIYEYNQRDARGHWNDIMNETTDVTGDVFLGMSMACARCHDHKFDPVLQKDYFKLRSFFEPLIWRDDLKAATKQEHRAHAEQTAIWKQATAEIQARIDALLKPYYDKKWIFTVDKFPLDIQACFNKPVAERSSLEQQMAYLVSRQFLEEGGGPLKNMSKDDKASYEALKKELAAFDHLKPKPLPSLMSATDFDGALSPTTIPEDPNGTPVPPGFLTVLAKNPQAKLPLPKTHRGSGRRTALANWISSDDNPLTARVIVNRIWQQHFGQGIVATPNDFGHNGTLPSHPELMDWLTDYFIQNEWRFKALHRAILLSAVWKQSSEHPLASSYRERDPSESLLWRFRIQRLKAEQIRDAMLMASEELDNRIGGPSINEAHPGRALYMKQFRNQNNSLLHAFDLGGGLKSVAVRNTTTTPTQSLIMINGEYVLSRAKKMAARLTHRYGSDARALIQEAVQRCWGRAPSTDEIKNAIAFLNVTKSSEEVDIALLTDFCHVLLNSNEFLYLD